MMTPKSHEGAVRDPLGNSISRALSARACMPVVLTYHSLGATVTLDNVVPSRLGLFVGSPPSTHLLSRPFAPANFLCWYSSDVHH